MRHHQSVDGGDLNDRVLDLVREIICHQRADQIEAFLVIGDELGGRHLRERATRGRHVEQGGKRPPESAPSLRRDRARTLLTGDHEKPISLRGIAGIDDLGDANTVRSEEPQRPLFFRNSSVRALDLHDNSLLPDLPEPGSVLRSAAGSLAEFDPATVTQRDRIHGRTH